MALTPNFSASESLGSPEQITLTDTSTGSDTLTSRIVYFLLANGSYLTNTSNTNNFESWPIADTTKTFSVLDRSQAVSIIVIWLNGSTQAYTKTILYGFDLYDYIFGYKRLQNLTSSPKLMDNSNFYNGMIRLVVNLFCEETAILYGDDIYSAQEALNRNYELIQNPIEFY